MMSRRPRLEQERCRSRSPLEERRSLSRSISNGSDIKLSSGRIVIRGLPKDYDWIKVKELFLREVGFSGFLELVIAGTAVMVFKSVPGAVKAIKIMDGFKLGDETLTVTEESEMDRTELRVKQDRNSDKNEGRRSGGNFHPSRHHEGMQGRNERPYRNQRFSDTSMDCSRYMTPEVLEYLGIDGPLTNQVFVSHLDYSITWQKLKDIFRTAGNVLNAEVKENPDGSPRGLAVITFEHSYEAVQAVAMLNNQALCGRVMRVRMERDPHSGNSSASFYAYRRDERRENVGLPPNGRLPSGLENIGMTLKDIYRSLSGSSYRTNHRTTGSRSNGGYASGMSSSWRTNSDYHSSSGSRYRSSSNRGYEADYSNYSNEGYRGDSSRCVMIKNLPYDFTWRDLKRLMSEVGNVRFVDIFLSSNQHSTGIGSVRFASCADAERAVRKFDGMRVEGHTITVEMDFQH